MKINGIACYNNTNRNVNTKTKFGNKTTALIPCCSKKVSQAAKNIGDDWAQVQQIFEDLERCVEQSIVRNLALYAQEDKALEETEKRVDSYQKALENQIANDNQRRIDEENAQAEYADMLFRFEHGGKSREEFDYGSDRPPHNFPDARICKHLDVYLALDQWLNT